MDCSSVFEDCIVVLPYSIISVLLQSFDRPGYPTMKEQTQMNPRNQNKPLRQIIKLFVFLVFALSVWNPDLLSAQEDGKIQEIEGRVVQEGALVYSLPDLMAGDELYIFAERTSGNLDTIVAISPAVLTPEELRREFNADVDSAIARGEDPLTAVPRIIDSYFSAWDDDSGEGYSSILTYSVPEDDDYHLVITSSPAVDTFGDFRMQIGLNSPGVLTGRALPTGDEIAVLISDPSEIGVVVQELTGTLTPELNSTFYTLRDFGAGDKIYVYIEATSGDLRPIVLLNDSGEKSVRSGNFSGSDSFASLEYTFDSDASNMRIDIEACCEDGPATQGDFRLLVGANAPEVLNGQADPTGGSVVKEPILVNISTILQQITNVDQKAENFGVVATLDMEWFDPRLAFSPDTCDCSFQVYNGTDFADFIVENELVWPEFTLFNQQGRRFTQNQFAVVRPSGDAYYFERFSATLQAPVSNSETSLWINRNSISV